MLQFQFNFRCFSQAKTVQEIQWSLCKCTPKFPQKELDFYAEQKFTRKGTFGGIDLKGSQKLGKCLVVRIVAKPLR